MKIEDCKDCYDSGLLCRRHQLEQMKKFVRDGYHVSYWLDLMAEWIATKSDDEFRYYCRLLTGARYMQMVHSEQPPMSVASSAQGRKERLKAAYEQLDTAHNLSKASNGYFGFNEYCQARQVILDIFDEPQRWK